MLLAVISQLFQLFHIFHHFLDASMVDHPRNPGRYAGRGGLRVAARTGHGRTVAREREREGERAIHRAGL